MLGRAFRLNCFVRRTLSKFAKNLVFRALRPVLRRGEAEIKKTVRKLT